MQASGQVCPPQDCRRLCILSTSHSAHTVSLQNMKVLDEEGWEGQWGSSYVTFGVVWNRDREMSGHKAAAVDAVFQDPGPHLSGMVRGRGPREGAQGFQRVRYGLYSRASWGVQRPSAALQYPPELPCL